MIAAFRSWIYRLQSWR